MTCRSLPAALGAALLLVVPVPPALALIGDTPTIRGAAVVRSPIIDSGECPIVLLGQNANGSFSLILRTINEQTGALVAPDQVAPIPNGVMPMDLIYSTIFRPGSVLVLDDARRAHEFPVAFNAMGHPKFTTVMGPNSNLSMIVVHQHGPFGPDDVGAGTALAEAVAIVDPKVNHLGIGTASGTLVVRASRRPRP